jgi:uncharacterized protein YjgD (DUF1641 family)
VAQAIQQIVRPVKSEAEIEAERLAQVRKQTALDADGLVEGLKLLQAMHDRGVLELLVAVFERGDRVLQKLVDFAAQPGTTQVMKNLAVAMEMWSQLDSGDIQKLAHGVSSGLASAKEVSAPKPIGVFELLRELKDPDVSAAVRAVLAFLKGFGQTLREAEHAAEHKTEAAKRQEGEAEP